MHEYNSFLTLTYDDDHLPEDGSLNVKHFQDFAKRLRSRVHPRTFRFFHCGEYGDNTNRPHYHAALFGIDFHEDRKVYKHTKQGHTLHTSELLDSTWSNGQCWIGELTFDSAAYIARYIMKKVTGDQAIPHYGHLKPEYVTMSRKPGIGSEWINTYMDEVYPADEVIINGKQARPPKFYDSQLEKRDPELYKTIIAKRAIDGAKHAENNTPDRLEVRETVKRAQTQTLTREL